MFQGEKATDKFVRKETKESSMRKVTFPYAWNFVSKSTIQKNKQYDAEEEDFLVR